MSKESIKIINISYAKRALQPGSRERMRMASYATLFDEYHVIVFTKRTEKFPRTQQEGNLYLYATDTHTRIGALWRAYRIGREIIEKNKKGQYIVSSQDPFETALVGRAVASGNRATNHIQIHGDVFSPHSYRTSLLQKLRVLYGRYVVRNTACIRVVSQRIKHSLTALGVATERVTVLPIQSNLASFLAVGERRVRTTDQHPSFLYVGRFAPEKNLPLLIKSFAAAIKHRTGPTLTLVGTGEEYSTLRKLIADVGMEGSIRIQPWTDDISTVMATHDVFCLTSNHEGWGMVLIEAAAAGMPVITTNVGCAGEFVRDRENGQVVPVGNFSQYTEAITTYLQEPVLIDAHGQRGYQLAREYALSDTEYLKQFGDVYTSCLPKEPAILEGNATT